MEIEKNTKEKERGLCAPRKDSEARLVGSDHSLSLHSPTDYLLSIFGVPGTDM